MPQRKKSKQILICALMGAVFTIASCTSTQRMDEKIEILSDTGDLTRTELQRAAKVMAKSLSIFKENGKLKKTIFIALLPTKNETTELLPVTLFDSTIVDELLKNQIYTVRIENRTAALKELEFNMTGLAGNKLSAGMMKSPNYFLKTTITENTFYHKKKKILEHILRSELTEVESQLVIWSEEKIYRKKVKSSNNLEW